MCLLVMEPCIHHLLNAAFAFHDSNPTTLVQTPNDDKRATNKGFNNDVMLSPNIHIQIVQSDLHTIA